MQANKNELYNYTTSVLLKKKYSYFHNYCRKIIIYNPCNFLVLYKPSDTAIIIYIKTITDLILYTSANKKLKLYVPPVIPNWIFIYDFVLINYKLPVLVNNRKLSLFNYKTDFILINYKNSYSFFDLRIAKLFVVLNNFPHLANSLPYIKKFVTDRFKNIYFFDKQFLLNKKFSIVYLCKFVLNLFFNIEWYKKGYLVDFIDKCFIKHAKSQISIYKKKFYSLVSLDNFKNERYKIYNYLKYLDEDFEINIIRLLFVSWYTYLEKTLSKLFCKIYNNITYYHFLEYSYFPRILNFEQWFKNSYNYYKIELPLSPFFSVINFFDYMKKILIKEKENFTKATVYYYIYFLGEEYRREFHLGTI